MAHPGARASRLAGAHHSGTVDGNIVSGDWFVIAGSGTGELSGLRGEGGFQADLGESVQVYLDHWFE
jgi:hypothetical protein